jgi:hypothetical protein
MTTSGLDMDTRDKLLEDAHLVVDYGVRAGRLPDDDALQKAIYAVESATQESATQAFATLTSALNKAINAISPMSLNDLREGRSPFDPTNRPLVQRLQVLFCVLTIVLTLIVALLTETLHRQDNALKAIEQIQNTHPMDKLSALRKMVKLDAVLKKQDSVSYDQYQQGVRELRELQDKLSGLYYLLDSASVRVWLPTFFDQNAPDSGQGYSAEDAKYYQTLKSMSETQDKDIAVKAAGATTSAYAVTIPCTTASPPWMQQAIENLLEEHTFSHQLNLLLSLPPTSKFYQIQAEMAALNGWVLPFLYGLLGAMMFVMRNLLDPRTPILGLFQSIVRIALGGLAGILIGWFWVPSAFKAGEVADISSTPFGLAFLAGFSIDILFSILDRISRSVNGSTTLKTL